MPKDELFNITHHTPTSMENHTCISQLDMRALCSNTMDTKTKIDADIAKENKHSSVRKHIHRCHVEGCMRKAWSVSVLAPCRCSGVFCRVHRFPSEHHCTCEVYYRNLNEIDGIGGGQFAKIDKIG